MPVKMPKLDNRDFLNNKASSEFNELISVIELWSITSIYWSLLVHELKNYTLI